MPKSKGEQLKDMHFEIMRKNDWIEHISALMDETCSEPRACALAHAINYLSRKIARHNERIGIIAESDKS